MMLVVRNGCRKKKKCKILKMDSPRQRRRPASQTQRSKHRTRSRMCRPMMCAGYTWGAKDHTWVRKVTRGSHVGCEGSHVWWRITRGVQRITRVVKDYTYDMDNTQCEDEKQQSEQQRARYYTKHAHNLSLEA
jgi:hypothetical protein